MPVFVDDITLAGTDSAKIDSIVQELSQHFKLCDLGPITQLLGMGIHRDCPNCHLFLSQSQHITNLFQEHGLHDCKPVSTPLNPGSRLSTSMSPQNDAEVAEMCQHPYISVVGSLMYLAVTTRPDIAYAARVLARFNSNPGLAHWQAAKHVLRYLKGTMDHSIIYQPSDSPEPFITYSDVPIIKAHHCNICHGADHPRGFCPFARLQGWRGPDGMPDTARKSNDIHNMSPLNTQCR